MTRFEVRKKSRFPGFFDQERVNGRGCWRPVGTHAAYVLRSVPSPTTEDLDLVRHRTTGRTSACGRDCSVGLCDRPGDARRGGAESSQTCNGGRSPASGRAYGSRGPCPGPKTG